MFPTSSHTSHGLQLCCAVLVFRDLRESVGEITQQQWSYLASVVNQAWTTVQEACQRNDRMGDM